jgi:phage anti-repressor protein
METKVKVTKELYRMWDSYNRHQRWVGNNLLKALKGYYGMGKSDR